MRRTFLTSGIAAFASCVMLSVSVNAQTTADAQAAYEALSQSPAASTLVHTATTSDGSRFFVVGETQLAPPKPFVPITTQTPTNPTLAVKIWFERMNGDQPTGQFVNPAKYKFQKLERFRVWVDSATPITMAISQYYPDTSMAGKPVYPDANYPATFGVIPPGRGYPLPVLFAMDDTLDDEHMMLAISDATTSGSGIAWSPAQLAGINASPNTQLPTALPSPNFGGSGGFINNAPKTPNVGAGTSRFLAAVTAGIEKTTANDIKNQNRFFVVGPSNTPVPTPNPPPVSENPGDVQSVLLHANGTGVATFQLHKD